MKRKFALLVMSLCVLTVIFLRLDCPTLKCYATENGVNGISPSEGVNDFYAGWGDGTVDNGTSDDNTVDDTTPNDSSDDSTTQNHGRSTQGEDSTDNSADNGIGWGMAIVYIIIAAAVVLLIIAILPKKPV